MPFLKRNRPERMPEEEFDTIARCVIRATLAAQRVMMAWCYRRERIEWSDALPDTAKVQAALRAAKLEPTKSALLVWVWHRVWQAEQDIRRLRPDDHYCETQRAMLPILKKLHADLLYIDKVDIEGVKEMCYAALMGRDYSAPKIE